MAQYVSQDAASEPEHQPFIGRGTLAATVGNMLEFYDFITYSFFAIQIGHTFFPSHSQFASLMLSLAILSINLIGDAARDALDPRMKQREGGK